MPVRSKCHATHVVIWVTFADTRCPNPLGNPFDCPTKHPKEQRLV